MFPKTEVKLVYYNELFSLKKICNYMYLIENNQWAIPW